MQDKVEKNMKKKKQQRRGYLPGQEIMTAQQRRAGRDEMKRTR